MTHDKIVIDTNVILSGLTSQKGASYTLLQDIPDKKFTIVLSVPLVLEYETVLLNNLELIHLTREDIADFLDFFCYISEHFKIYYLWRPILKDPYDDHILELAVSSSSQYIVTYNLKDFQEASLFGIEPVTPETYLTRIGG